MGLKKKPEDFEWVAIWRAVVYMETGILPSLLDGLTKYHKVYHNGNWPEIPKDEHTIFQAIDECAEYHEELGLNPWNLSD